MPPYSKTLSWVNTCTAKTNQQSEGEGICMDMKQWVADQIQAKEKKALPVLTFPAAEKLGITTKELIYSPDLQAQAMKYIYDHTDMAAVLAFMDLSVEAEAFGSTIRYSDDEVPTVVGSIVDEDSNVDELVVPDPREGRTGLCIEGVRLIAEQIDDKPVIAGCVGPFSLTGRLMDVNEVMFLCYDEPELVHAVLEKTTSFIISYVKELKAAGADGVMMAEPLAGLLSPDLTEEFSNPYVKRIIDETQDDEFIVILHNCGSSVSHTIDSIVETGAAGFHLGNAIDMAEMMPHIPADRLAYGNIDPAATLCYGTHEAVYAATAELLEKCSQYPNFVISSGCDIPQLTPWDNIDAFFAAVHDFYAEKVDEEKTAAAKESQPVVINDMTSASASLPLSTTNRSIAFPFILSSRVRIACSWGQRSPSGHTMQAWSQAATSRWPRSIPRKTASSSLSTLRSRRAHGASRFCSSATTPGVPTIRRCCSSQLTITQAWSRPMLPHANA